MNAAPAEPKPAPTQTASRCGVVGGGGSRSLDRQQMSVTFKSRRLCSPSGAEAADPRSPEACSQLEALRPPLLRRTANEEDEREEEEEASLSGVSRALSAAGTETAAGGKRLAGNQKENEQTHNEAASRRGGGRGGNGEDL